MNVREVTASFGQHVKFIVQNVEEVVQPSAMGQHGRNVFEVLLASQAAQSRPGRPSSVNVKTAKDKLFNAILEYLAEQELDWPSNEKDTQGKMCIRKLTDVLWILVGHHDVLSKQSCIIPIPFQRFQGYNIPEKHKHRKRLVSNLDGDVIRHHSSMLFDLLHAPFWNRHKWRTFKGDVVVSISKVRIQSRKPYMTVSNQ